MAFSVSPEYLINHNWFYFIHFRLTKNEVKKNYLMNKEKKYNDEKSPFIVHLKKKELSLECITRLFQLV